MKAIKLKMLVTIAISILIVGATSSLFASFILQMSFDEVLNGADLVVLGKVVESPEIGVFDPELGVRKQHTIWVEQYVKGEGPDTITVITRGGKYWKDTPEGPKLYEGISSAAPQLPPEGTEVLLFLRRWGNGYLIYSASHGVVPVETDSDGTRFLWLTFKSLEGMPADTLANYKAGLERGLKPGDEAYLGKIEVSALKSVAHRILSR